MKKSKKIARLEREVERLSKFAKIQNDIVGLLLDLVDLELDEPENRPEKRQDGAATARIDPAVTSSLDASARSAAEIAGRAWGEAAHMAGKLNDLEARVSGADREIEDILVSLYALCHRVDDLEAGMAARAEKAAAGVRDAAVGEMKKASATTDYATIGTGAEKGGGKESRGGGAEGETEPADGPAAGESEPSMSEAEREWLAENAEAEGLAAAADGPASKRDGKPERAPEGDAESERAMAVVDNILQALDQLTANGVEETTGKEISSGDGSGEVSVRIEADGKAACA